MVDQREKQKQEQPPLGREKPRPKRFGLGHRGGVVKNRLDEAIVVIDGMTIPFYVIVICNVRSVLVAYCITLLEALNGKG